MAEVKWIKIVTDIFENRKIRQIEKMPEGDSIIVVWFKILCLAGSVNENGFLSLTSEIPYTEEMLAVQFGKPLATIRLALSTFKAFGMIEIIDDVLCISSWQKYQNTDKLSVIKEQNRLRQAKYRQNRKVLGKNNATVTQRITLHNGEVTHIDKDIDIERDIEVDNSISNDILPSATSSTEPNESVFIKLPLISNQDFIISFEKVAELQELYPAIDVEQGLRNMKGWLISNPKNRKTEKGIMRFVTGWLSRDKTRQDLKNSKRKAY